MGSRRVRRSPRQPLRALSAKAESPAAMSLDRDTKADPRHVPVLLAEVLEALAVKPGGIYLDGTFGAGGYSRAILGVPGTRVLALDRDPRAIAEGAGLVAASGGRLILRQSRFADLRAAAADAGVDKLDGATFDIGVSSMQIDEAERGFSFRFDGPLDMRMETSGRSAADIVNEADEDQLADIFYHYGEERMSYRLARAIVADRKAAPFRTTRQLAELAGRVIRHKPTEIHPATRVFQALRIAVNDELGQLARALCAAEAALAPGGRLAIVSFHSLEDRIVKRFFAERSGRGQAGSRLLPGEPRAPDPTFEAPGRQPILPGEAETAANPRARSARLRFAIRTTAEPRGDAGAILELAALPDRSTRRRP